MLSLDLELTSPSVSNPTHSKGNKKSFCLLLKCRYKKNYLVTFCPVNIKPEKVHKRLKKPVERVGNAFSPCGRLSVAPVSGPLSAPCFHGQIAPLVATLITRFTDHIAAVRRMRPISDHGIVLTNERQFVMSSRNSHPGNVPR